eukprot:Gregarina_sp_Poly_1__10898@NODE_84_length_15393_cov_100_561529_g72_i0_p6_GENE_NODE_84_length_15393_cov_100_561529_g72_i0NODE_84_length_15393_cov_100_561529_g72_i0_p6_ORF_typecomplete_len245_score51_89DUF1168/PF06658_12/2_1e25AAA_23/PF13476_6/0_0024Coilin_N/PF15862_5/0_024Rrn6/PF10214_9/0_056PHC2_SAM_assoc/PF16616_5/0_17SMC_N/PF02463_19/0_16LCD1/PF09798_9/0_52Mt_ATPsynt_B/PF05405_14/0_83AspBHydro_N/PF05279_11/0_96FlgT_N/PF16548_5/2_5DUF4407/PF14362_6/1_5_NODE_84_length_15393_cov_100_561529_g72_i0
MQAVPADNNAGGVARGDAGLNHVKQTQITNSGADDCGLGQFDWIVLSNGARVQVPKLPPQEDTAAGGSNLAACSGAGDGGPNDKGFHLLDKVRSAWGSTAGAGSDFFHVYRKQRAREMARQEALEKAWQEAEEMRKFQEKRLANFKADEDRAKKRAEKRKRKRQAQAHRKSAKKQCTEAEASAPAKPSETHDQAANPSLRANEEDASGDEGSMVAIPAANKSVPAAAHVKPAVKLLVNDDEDTF